MQKREILQKIYDNFQAKTGYGIVVGIEQEFYLAYHCEESNDVSMTRQSSVKDKEGWIASSHSLQSTLRNDKFSSLLPYSSLTTSLAAFPFFSEIEEEKGEGQFEVQIHPTDNPAAMADMVEMLRGIIRKPPLPMGEGWGEGSNNKKINIENTIIHNSTETLTPALSHREREQASFEAKPYPDQPGSGLHINVNLTDASGNNLFTKNGEEESKILEYAIAGLLELMPASMKYFAPYEAAYIRHTEQGMESPSTISWGGDNRTVSLRIPSVPLNPYARRIEHRVPCADADPYVCIAAIIAGIEYGIVNKLENKHPKIYGNAFLPQYSLPKLPMSFKEAEVIRHEYLNMAIGEFMA